MLKKLSVILVLLIPSYGFSQSGPYVNFWNQLDSIEHSAEVLVSSEPTERNITTVENEITSLLKKKDVVLGKNKNTFVDKLINARVAHARCNLELARNFKNTSTRIISNTTFYNLSTLIRIVRNNFPTDLKAFDEFTNTNPGNNVLDLFDMKSSKWPDFKSQIWDKYCADFEPYITDIEDQYFDFFTPNKTRYELWEFIRRSVYLDNKYYNHKVLDAFKYLFLWYTNTGENSSIAGFSNYINIRTKNTFPWDRLISDNSFISFRDSLGSKYRGWENVILDSMASEAALAKVIKEAASWEIGFLALQRIIKPQLINLDFNAAAKIIGKYKTYFENQSFWSETNEKVEGLLNMLNSNRGQWKFNPIKEVNTDNNEIKYILNSDNSAMVIEGENRANSKKFSIDKKNNKFIKDQDEFLQYTSPDFMWFEKRNDIKNKVIYKQQSDFHVNGFPYMSDDFFISDDGKILFFVSTDTIGRLNHNQIKNEYSSPGLINSKNNRFQEKEQRFSFHGKVSGNPNTDIYYCVKLVSGWTSPRILEGVNSAYCERSPIFDQKNNYLYFASEGFGGLGGFDIYRANVTLSGSGSAELEVKMIVPEIENVFEANSPYDDLYFNPNAAPYIVSSNRNGKDFDLYQINIKEIQKKAFNSEQKNEIPVKEINNKMIKNESKPNTRISGDVQPIFTFDWECINDARAKDDKTGFIMVKGKIYYSDSSNVKKAKISFSDAEGNYYFFKTINGDNRYNTEIPYKAELYKVKVTVYYENGDSIQNETESFLRVCDNELKNKRIVQDYIVPKKGQQSYFSTCPFFFDTNISNKTITNEKQARVYYKQDADDYRYVCIGYADMRGDFEYNKQLALKRANFAREFLLNLSGVDINAPDVTVESRGATEEFSKLDIKNYGNILNFSVGNKAYSQRDIELLLNRRVEIRKEKKYILEEN